MLGPPRLIKTIKPLQPHPAEGDAPVADAPAPFVPEHEPEAPPVESEPAYVAPVYVAPEPVAVVPAVAPVYVAPEPVIEPPPLAQGDAGVLSQQSDSRQLHLVDAALELTRRQLLVLQRPALLGQGMMVHVLGVKHLDPG